MKKTLVKSLAMAFVGSLLMAGSALALPTTNVDAIDVTGLQTMFTNAGSTINVTTKDTGAEFFQFQSQGASATYVANLSGKTGITFGLYDAADKTNQLTLFSQSFVVGNSALVKININNYKLKAEVSIGDTDDDGFDDYSVIDTADFLGNDFGFYVTNANNETYYSALTANGTGDNFLTFAGENPSGINLPGIPANANDLGHWYIAANASATNDGSTDNFSDIVASVESMQPVPEPATMLLLGTGLVGLAGARRRKTTKA